MIDYKQLSRDDILNVTDIAHYHLQRLRPPEAVALPVRVSAQRRDDLPGLLQYSFYFENEWQAGRDVYCRANDLDFVIDKVSVRRMRGCTIDWQGDEQQGGFTFDNPAWPPAIPEPPEQPAHIESSGSVGLSKSGLGIGGAVGLMLLVGGLKFFLHTAGQAEEQAKADAARKVQNEKILQDEGERLRERMRRGEDIDEALLIVLGMRTPRSTRITKKRFAPNRQQSRRYPELRWELLVLRICG